MTEIEKVDLALEIVRQAIQACTQIARRHPPEYRDRLLRFTEQDLTSAEARLTIVRQGLAPLPRSV